MASVDRMRMISLMESAFEAAGGFHRPSQPAAGGYVALLAELRIDDARCDDGQMDRLSTRDYESMLGITAALLDSDDPETFSRLVVEELVGSLHGAAGAYIELHPATGEPKVMAWTPESPGQIVPTTQFDEFRHAHPLARHYEQTADLYPRTISDVVDRSWYRSAYADAMRSTVGAWHQLSIPLAATSGRHRGYAVVRSGRDDFTARDRAYARRLQPLLVQIDRHHREIHRLRAAERHLPQPRLQSAAPAAQPLDRAADYRLTPRELIVLSLLADGLTAAAISQRLGISPHTVTKHQEHLYRKLGVSDRLTAVLRGQRLGLLTPGDPTAPYPP